MTWTAGRASGITTAPCIVQSPNAGIADSARKHGVDDEDLLHALRPLQVIDQDDRNSPRVLVIGVDRAGRLLEVVVLRLETLPLVVHGMLRRPSLHRSMDERR